MVLAEIWPSLHDASRIDHPIKDARQVIATRDAMINGAPLAMDLPPAADREGWIVGAATRVPLNGTTSADAR